LRCKTRPDDDDGQCDRNFGHGSSGDGFDADAAYVRGREGRIFDSVMHVLFLFSLHEASYEPMLLMMMSSVMEMRRERMFSASSSTPDQTRELLDAGLRMPSHSLIPFRTCHSLHHSCCKCLLLLWK
jgi:hypothetical protein